MRSWLCSISSALTYRPGCLLPPPCTPVSCLWNECAVPEDPQTARAELPSTCWVRRAHRPLQAGLAVPVFPQLEGDMVTASCPAAKRPRHGASLTGALGLTAGREWSSKAKESSSTVHRAGTSTFLSGWRCQAVLKTLAGWSGSQAGGSRLRGSGTGSVDCPEERG